MGDVMPDAHGNDSSERAWNHFLTIPTRKVCDVCQVEDGELRIPHDLSDPLPMVSSDTQLLARRYEGRLDEALKKLEAKRCETGAPIHRSPLPEIPVVSEAGKGATFLLPFPLQGRVEAP